MSNVRPFMYHYSWDYYKSLIKTAVASAVVIGFITPFVAFIGALCDLERGGWAALWVVLILVVLSPLFASGWQIYQARKREMFVQSQVSLLGYSVYKVLSCERCTETRDFNDYTYEATFYKIVLKCLKDNHTTNLESG